MNDTMNSIKLIGTITSEPQYDHTVLGEAFYRIDVSVCRLSGVYDILPVIVSERLLGDAHVNTCEVGTAISINGQIRTYNRKIGDKSHLIITVFARDVGFFNNNEEKAVLPAPPLNEVEICGSICKPVIYRTTPFSREIADVFIAVNRRYGKSDYLPCIAWGRNARFAESLCLGDMVSVRGRLQSRIYQKALPDGTVEERTAYEISCSSIERIMN